MGRMSHSQSKVYFSFLALAAGITTQAQITLPVRGFGALENTGINSPVIVRDVSIDRHGGLAFLLGERTAPDSPPWIVSGRLEGGRVLPNQRIRTTSAIHGGLSHAPTGDFLTLEKATVSRSDRKLTFRTFAQDGRILSEAVADDQIAAFTPAESGVSWLSVDGTLHHRSAPGRSIAIPLIQDRSGFPSSTILRGSVSLVTLNKEEVAVVERYNGRVHVANVTTGRTRHSVLQAESLNQATATYAEMEERAKRELRPATTFTRATPALSTTADPQGNLYTLISPLNARTGATVIQTDSDGRLQRTLRLPVNLFSSERFGPSYLRHTGSELYLISHDGKVAAYSLREK